MPSAILVSATPAVIDSVAKICSSNDLHLDVCPDPATAITRSSSRNAALVLVHVRNAADTAGVQQLLREVATTRHRCATVILADAGHHQQAAPLLRAGAADYVELSGDPSKLRERIKTFADHFRAASTVVAPAVSSLPDHIGDDGLAALMDQVKRIAPQDMTVLLMGATGTGKTRLGRMIHDLSPRREQPFLVIDCGSLSPALIESELFGHARGAFTGADRERTGKLAAAGNGTLLLDEINSLPLALQSKLLRAVDSRVFQPVGSNRDQPLRARLIAASNVSLEEEAAAGRFRSDLYYRLNVVGFFLPLLRERPAAVPCLARRFLAEFAARNRPDVRGFTPEALRTLEEYEWPGNVRELRNVVERALALCEGPEVTPQDLPEAVRATPKACLVNQAAPEDPPEPSPFSSEQGRPEEDASPALLPFTLEQARTEVEVRRIREALHKHNNNRLRAAAELGISRVGLYKKLHKLGLITPQCKKHMASV